MKKVIAVIVTALLAVALAGFVATISSAAPVNPPTSIVGVPNSEGTVVTWTITVTNNTPTGTAAFALLFPAHPAGSTTSLDPAGHGPVLTIVGNGTVTFTQTAAAGTTFCGENVEVSVDLLEGENTFSDLAGSVKVTSCTTPTTTTTSTTVPTITQFSVPTTTVPSTTSTTRPVPTTTSTTKPNGPGVVPPPAQPQVVLAPAPRVTG